MESGSGRRRIARFTNEQARERFLRAYDTAMLFWPEPRRETDVETSYGPTHVHLYGASTGTPIVLLHGATGNSSNWYHQVPPLGAGHPVYAVDTIDDPGRSVQRRVLDGSGDYAAWLDEVLGGLGLDRVHLVGMSYGGWLALNQAVYGSERIASVTLLDPGGLQKVPLRFFVNLLLGVFATLTPRRFRPRVARLLANQALIEPPEQLAPVMIAARSWRTNRPAARCLDDEELRAIRVPTQVLIAGRSSMLRPGPAADRANRLIPGVRTEIVPGAGHGLPLEEPERVSQRILDFVNRVDEARTTNHER